MEISTDQQNVFKMNEKTKRFSKGRRRSRSLGGLAVNGLCESIPTTLTLQARFEKLIELSFKHSLSALQWEFFVNEGFNIIEFKAQGNECWEKLRSMLEERNLFQLAVSDEMCTAELTTCEKITIYDKAIMKLDSEIQDWNALVSAQRETLEKALEYSPAPITVDNDLTHEYPDYSAILKSLSSENKKINLQISKLPALYNVFMTCLKLSDNYKAHFSMKSAEHFVKCFPDTPRATIKKIANAYKIVKDTGGH